MLKKALFIACSSLLFSCGDLTEVAIPDSVLPEEKMAEVLVDIHLLEASMNLNVAETDRVRPANIDIFSKHGTTRQEYDESYRFYTENPEKLAEVYQLVLNSLSKMQAEVVNSK